MNSRMSDKFQCRFGCNTIKPLQNDMCDDCYIKSVSIIGFKQKCLMLNDDFFNILPSIENDSIDMILTDLPYNITQNRWECEINLKKMWQLFDNIIKQNGIIILTAVQPFASQLILSSLIDFRYELIWEKSRGTGHLDANRKPLRCHEQLLVFYKKLPTYNPQMTEGTPYDKTKWNGKIDKTTNYNTSIVNKKRNDGTRFPRSIIKIKSMKNQDIVHPTQKPIELFEYLIKTYSNKGDTILDCCAGSGTTAIACINTKRNYICIEKDDNYFNIMKDRIAKHSVQEVLM